MKVPLKINQIRRQLMRTLTSTVGRSNNYVKKGKSDNEKVQRILISRPNARLGNLLLITPLVQDVVATFPNCKIDLFVRGNVAPIIFRNYPNIDRIVNLPAKPFRNLGKYLWTWVSIRNHKYDLAINVEQNSSSGRLSSLFSKSGYKIFGEINPELKALHQDYIHIAKSPVYGFRQYISQLGYDAQNGQVPTLNIQLTPYEIARGKSVLDDLVQNDKKTICLFTYATGDKCYPVDWWNNMYDKLLLKYPDYNIIEMLPAHNESQLNFRAPSFLSHDIREIAGILNNVELFIGADSGMMHLASASQATVIGLFWKTYLEKYEPYGNNSFGINTNNSSEEAWFLQIDKTLATLRKSRA